MKISSKDVLDVEAERGRLLKEQQKLLREMAAVGAQLENQQFLSKAPEKVVESLRQRRSELAVQNSKVAETLEKLG